MFEQLFFRRTYEKLMGKKIVPCIFIDYLNRKPVLCVGSCKTFKHVNFFFIF
ncbi:Uncharacterised protein [Mycobacteroides abscessus subsp. abscessus]|nr:Uncharacterised protein [Mycobacteroides abscessus subsp. abscessus]